VNNPDRLIITSFFYSVFVLFPTASQKTQVKQVNTATAWGNQIATIANSP